MKIGYVLKQFPKLSETFVLNEILELERQGADVTIFALDSGRDPRIHPMIARLRAPIHYLDSGGSAQFLGGLIQSREVIEHAAERLQSVAWELMAAPHLRPLPLLRQALELLCRAPHDLDRLHAHFAGPAAHVARIGSAALEIPFGFTCHAKDIYHESVDPEAFRSLHDSADAVITVCEANQRFVENQILGHASDRLHVLYNGIDLNLFARTDRRPSPEPTILAVGRMVPKKGFADLIGAMAVLRERGVDARCDLIGDGALRATLERQVQELGLEDRVRILGAVDQAAVRGQLREAWVLALPCVVADDGNRDALPTVLLEALAAGTPVVSTPVAGVEEIIRNGREGLLVPQRDPNALAAALGAVLGDRKLRDQMGARGRQTAEARFDLRTNVRALRSILWPTSRKSRVAPRVASSVTPLWRMGA